MSAPVDKEDLFLDAADDLLAHADNTEVVSPAETEDVSSKKTGDVGGDELHQMDKAEGEEGDGTAKNELEQLQSILEKTILEKENINQELKEERESVATLHHKLKALIGQRLSTGGHDVGLVDGHHEDKVGANDAVSVDTPLPVMINECSQFVKSALEKQSQTEDTVRELCAELCMKDQQIEELNAKLTELSASNDAAAGTQLEKDQHIDAVMSKMLASLATVIKQEEMVDDSVNEIIVNVEKGVASLIEKYVQMVYETEQLRQCLSQPLSDVRVQEEFGAVFSSARNDLLELRRKEVELMEKIRELEDENGKLAEKLEKDRLQVESVNEEVGKLKMELDQEKTRSANTKEKLSLAVTKGKALVQQRDTLKQSLADKTSELEKCLLELQEKSTALEAADLTKQEMEKMEKSLSLLQQELSQKNEILEKFEEVWSETNDVPVEVTSMDIVTRYRWFVSEMKNVKEELVKREKLIHSLQEMQSSRNDILGKCNQILSESNISEEVQSLDIAEKIKWLVHDRNDLKDVSTELQKLKNYFSLIAFPEAMSSPNLESYLTWLRESYYQAKTEISLLEDEITRTNEAACLKIDQLSALFSAELQEKYYLQQELDDLEYRHRETVENEHRLSLEKDQIVRRILEISGASVENQGEVYDSPSDIAILIGKCSEKLREQGSYSSYSSGDAEVFEVVKSLLYVRNQDWVLCENILEEETLLKSDVNNLSHQLTVVSEELVAVREEKDSLQKDLERSEEKSATLKEKLSMAVKKGKGLMQERENFKKLLVEKDSALEAAELIKEELIKNEKLVLSLQEELSRKNAILERFEELWDQTDVSEEIKSRDIIERFRWFFSEMKSMKEELVERENLTLSLQEMLSRRDDILGKCHEILSEDMILEEVQSFDIEDKVKWLVRERIDLKGLSAELQRLKDSFSLMELPQSFSSSNLESCMAWLRESYYQTRDEIKILQDEISRTREAACFEIDRLSALLAAELQEKDYLQKDLDDLEYRYKEIVDKEHQVSMEKDQMVRKILEVSGVSVQDQEGLRQPLSDIPNLIGRCFEKIREQENSSSYFDVDTEVFETMQSFLYVSNQDWMLCETLLEEEWLLRSDVNHLSDQLRVVSLEVVSAKEEKESLQKDLDRSEEKSALLKEKLSMAVKKGKGLMQDRENLKNLLEERTSEIEKLKMDLQQKECSLTDSIDQINKLSAELESVPKLKADIVSMKEEKNKFERFLLESNNMLQRVIESIDCIVLPVDMVFEEPTEKLKWVAGYLTDCGDVKTRAEAEVEKLKEERSVLASSLAEAKTTKKLLEDALSAAENNASRLAEVKRELELSKEKLEQDLLAAEEEARTHSSKFVEALAAKNSLEYELSQQESKVSMLTNEKKAAISRRDATETELEKTKMEISIQSGKIAEAYSSMKSLQDAYSQLEANVAMLTEQNTHMETELKRLQDEAESQASKLADACREKKSLEDALSKAENDICVLEAAKKSAEQEVLVLNSKLNGCMEELTGKSSSLESNSLELIGYINDLQLLMRDESIMSIIKQCFGKKFDDLKEIDNILKLIRNQYVNAGQEMWESHSLEEDGLHVANPHSDSFESMTVVEMEDIKVNAAKADDISLCFGKIVEGFKFRNKILCDKVEGLALLVDEFTRSILRKLQVTKDEAAAVLEYVDSLKQKLKEANAMCERAVEEKDFNQNRVSKLERDLETLQYSCAELTQKLKDYQAKEDMVKEREEEILSSQNLLRQEQDAEPSFLSASQTKALFDKINEINIPVVEAELGDTEPHYFVQIKKLFYIIDNYTQLQNQINLLSLDRKELQSSLKVQKSEMEYMKMEVEELTRNKEDLAKMKSQLSELSFGFGKLLNIVGGNDLVEDYKSADVIELFPVLEKQVLVLHSDNESSKYKTEELNLKLLESQGVVAELSAKVRFLEDSLEGKTANPEIVQERRSIFEAPSLPTGSEISEIEDVVPVRKKTVSPVSSASMVRNMRKGSTEHLGVNIDLESQQLLDNELTDEEKGHVFKSLNTSGLVPKQGKLIADRIDGIWASGGRALMRRPGARLGLIAYWLLVHIWLLGTIL